MKAVFDTNILIDYLNGYVQAANELRRCREPMISRITWIEVLAGVRDKQQARGTEAFLSLFHVQELTPEIAANTVPLRRERRLRLPDAIILATAHDLGCPLLTRNTKDFSPQ